MSAIRSQVRNSKLMTQRSRQVMQARRLKALQWAVALALGTSVCGSAYAMRVGHSRVVSVPGAPLQAVVGLQELTPDEIASLRVSVADEAAWLRAGLKPPVPLADLVVGVENGMDATRKNLRVRSSQAPASGAVDLLLDISSSAGQRQVQVSILVAARAGADATPASVGGKARAGASAGGATLNVKPGDTLYAIAQRNAVPGASIYQMLVALWRANPQAFIQSNMNLLKAGQKLSIPDADAVRAIDPAEARRIFNEHAEAFASTARAWARRRARIPPWSRAERSVRHCQSFRRYRRRFRRVRPGPPAPVQRTGRRPGASRRPGRCQGVRRTRDGRCAGAGDYVAGQRGRVEQGGGRAGRGRTGRCDGRWRRSGIGGCCRRCGCLWLCGCCGLDGAAGAAGSGGAAGAAGTAGSAAAAVVLAPPDRLARPARQAPPDRPEQRAPPGRQERRARQAPRVPVPLRERRASRCGGFRRRRFGCGPGRRFRRFGTRRQERCGPEAVRSAGRRAVLADRQSAGDRHRRAGAARLHHRLGAAPRARRGDDDEETYAYAEPALDTAALNRKLETISLDLDEPPSDEPRRPGAPKA